MSILNNIKYTIDDIVILFCRNINVFIFVPKIVNFHLKHVQIY